MIEKIRVIYKNIFYFKVTNYKDYKLIKDN